MKSIERRFNNVMRAPKHDGIGEYLGLAATIDGTGIGTKYIKAWFKKLVPKDDYLRSEEEELLNHLYRLSVPQKDAEGASRYQKQRGF